MWGGPLWGYPRLVDILTRWVGAARRKHTPAGRQHRCPPFDGGARILLRSVNVGVQRDADSGVTDQVGELGAHSPRR